jgi:hypothetical protein
LPAFLVELLRQLSKRHDSDASAFDMASRISDYTSLGSTIVAARRLFKLHAQ